MLPHGQLPPPSLQPLVIWPDEKLCTVCDPVEDIRSDDTQQLISDMIHTVRVRGGLGLAAPQVGNFSRLFILRSSYEGLAKEINKETGGTDPGGIPDDRIDVMVNPELVKVDDTLTFPWDEGCLSVPGYFERRWRPKRVIVHYSDQRGHEHEREAQGLAAFVIQHELDHLDGKVFVDDLSRLKQDRVKKKIAKTLRNQQR